MAKKVILIGLFHMIALVLLASRDFYTLHRDGYAVCTFCDVRCDILPLALEIDGTALTWQIVCPSCGRRAKLSEEEANFLKDPHDYDGETARDERDSPKGTTTPDKTTAEVTDDIFDLNIDEYDNIEDPTLKTDDREIRCSSCGRPYPKEDIFWYMPRAKLLSREVPERNVEDWVPICQTCAVKYFYSDTDGAVSPDASGIRRPTRP